MLRNILITTYMDHFRSNKQTRTIFNSPTSMQWAVCGQPSHQASVPLCETEIHGHFRPNNSQTIIYCINYNISNPNSSWTVQNNSQFPAFQFKIFGTDQTASHGLIPPKGLIQVGENPYLLEFVETPQNRCPRVALAA